MTSLDVKTGEWKVSLELGSEIVHMCKDDAEYQARLLSHIKKGAACYLYPTIPNFAGVDSILYIPTNEPGRQIIDFQITAAASHSVSISNFQRIQRWFNAPASWTAEEKQRVQDLRPTITNQWQIVFVTPKPRGDCYQVPQRLDPGRTKHEVSGDMLPAASLDEEEDEFEEVEEPQPKRVKGVDGNWIRAPKKRGSGGRQGRTVDEADSSMGP
jgi:hypothetical protein